MKNFKKILLTSITLLTMTVAMAFSVSADTTTDLSSLKVYGVDAAGKKTEIPLSFNPTTYTYDLTVKSNILQKLQMQVLNGLWKSRALTRKWTQVKILQLWQ